jgi:hypothetical protein
MKLKVFALVIAISLIGQIDCPVAFSDAVSVSMVPGKINWKLETTTPKRDVIRLNYEAVAIKEKESGLGRTFKITVFCHDKNMTLLGGENFEISETFKNFIQERDADAHFMIELLYPTGKNFYSRMEVLQGVSKPGEITKIQVLKYPVYSNVGDKISDIRNGVLIKAESICHMMAPKITLLNILNGDLDNTSIRRVECMEVNPQAIVFGAQGEISTVKAK